MKGYITLQHAYGWSKEYIKGKWVKVCNYSKNPCVGSCLERKTCQEYDLELYGLTRPLFVKLVQETNNEMYEREKRLYNAFSLMITGSLFIKETKEVSVNVEEKRKDILYDFPYDMEYPTEKVILDNVKYWDDYNGEPTLNLWTEERADACRGKFGVIARRCSINDLLWKEYKEGLHKNQKSLKCRIKLDHIRIGCYPSSHRDKICVEPPTVEHFNHIKENGNLKIFKTQLDDCGFKLEDVIPVTDELIEIIKEV